MPDQLTARSPFLIAAVAGECPACGSRTLFDGWVRFAPRCRDCGEDFSSFNVGDGPAAFLILTIGALVCALALVLQVKASPPFWVHIVLWVPITTALVLLSLRVSKAAMLIHEARAGVREGRVADDPGQDG